MINTGQSLQPPRQTYIVGLGHPQMNSNFSLLMKRDVEMATNTLAAFTKSVAYCLAEKVPDADIKVTTEKDLLNSTKAHIRQTKKVKVPHVKADDFRLMKILFKFDDNDIEPLQHHPPPDPYLLFIKAVTCWSSMQNQRLLAVCYDDEER